MEVRLDGDGVPRAHGQDAKRCHWCQDMAQDVVNINGRLFPIDTYCRERVLPRVINRLRRNVKE